jgi:hypothetical protein
MRRLGVLIVVAVLSLGGVLAGCGSSKLSAASSTPASTELSYFPSGSVFVLSVQTDPNSAAVKQTQALLGKFPLFGLGKSAVIAKLEQLGIDYQGDVEPLFGNPLTVGLATPTAAGDSSKALLGVWVTKDAGKLAALIKKIPGLKNVGSHDGATLYTIGSDATLAVDGATAVIGNSQATVNAALDRHANGGGISAAAYSKAFSGLPKNTVIQAFGSLTGVLSQPSAAAARKVPWVAALRAYAVTLAANSSGLAFTYRLDTTGGSLTAAQVPFASGTGSPNLTPTTPIAAGIENPAHVVQFIESVGQITDPAGYAKFQRHQAALRAKTGVDLNSLVQLLSGELIVGSDRNTTMGRATLSDPASAARILAKLARAPRNTFGKTTRVRSLGRGFYAIRDSGGAPVIVGVASNQLVAGNTRPARLRAFAAAPTASLAGAQGSVTFRVALASLLHVAMPKQVPQIAQMILSSLGDITGWVSSDPTGITGTASLAIH